MELSILKLKANPMIRKQILTMSALLICFQASAHAASIAIDGNLADWGLQRNGNAADWNPNPLLVPPNQYKVEDQTGLNTRLFPGWGGQAYDAEAIYTFIDSGSLYIALVTGLSPDTPDNHAGNSYGPGDFAIDFGGDGSFEFGIETTGTNKGKVYQVGAWEYGLWDIAGEYNPSNPDLAHPTSIKTGTQVGIGELIYTNSWFKKMGEYVKDKHYVIEAAIPLSVFDGFSGKFDVHWTMNCANDAIWADPILPATVPEPASIALLALGLFAMAAKRKPSALLTI
jgi:hypothetical protein